MFSKLLLCAAVLMLIVSCASAQQMPPPQPIITGSGQCTQNCDVISPADVFTNQAETWNFANIYGDVTIIDVMPQPDGSSVWHYTKSSCRAYWTPGACAAELYFKLELIDGRWYSTGGHVMFPYGAPWNHSPQDFTYTVSGDPGMPRPYLIIGESFFVDNTTFPDPNPGTRWLTMMYPSNGFLISEQWEGNCVHERWWFERGRGLVFIEPIDTGNCQFADHNLVMYRIN